jgi:hypothetical protein
MICLISKSKSAKKKSKILNKLQHKIA